MARAIGFTSRKQLRWALLPGVAWIALTAVAAQAQDMPPAGSPAKTAAPDAAPVSNEPGDIVVTANRREQRLQDVGVAVTALGAETLQNLSITNSTDIVRAVPSLKMNTYSSAAVVYNIRGVSQNDYGDQQEPPVAVYQDDSYASTLNLAGFPVFDLARVEVLRGPQGTLFGRNATGGAIQFVSNSPSKEFEGDASATYGSYNQLILEGAVSGPLTDNLQVRIAGIRNKSDGYLKNIDPNGTDRGGNNSWALRGKVAWQPTTDLKALLTLRYARNDHETQAGQYTAEQAYTNADGQGTYLPATLDAFGTGPGADVSGYRNDAINPQRGGNPYLIDGNNRPNYVDRTLFGASLRIDADLDSRLSLTSITDYQHGKKFYSEDGDGTSDDLVYFYQGSEIDQYSQEFRLTGKYGAHTITAGAMAMAVNGTYFGSFSLPLFNYFPVANFTQDTRSVAVFAEDEWKVSDKLKLIVGGRFWHDNRKVDYRVDDGTVAVVFNDQEVSPATPGVSPSDANRGFSDFTVRAEVDYKPVDNVLTYASYNRGSKSGGFTLSVATPAASAVSQFIQGLSYDPETLNAYEVGIKSTITRGTTLNVAAFYYDYRGYQAFVQYGPVQTVVNLNAKVKGLEAELATRPIQGLTMQIGTSFLDTNVKNVPLPSGRVTDRDLPQAPGFSGNALIRYELPIGPGVASIQADGQYTGGFCFSTLCAPVEQERKYALLNGRVAFAANSGWELAFFVNNITDKLYRVYAVDGASVGGTVASIYARPRTWGLVASMKFGASR